MKHNINVLPVLLIICMAFGCKKENTPPGTDPTNNSQKFTGCYVLSYKDKYSHLTFEYDDLGRITKAKESDGDYTTYGYGTTTVTMTDYDALGAKKKERLAQINSKGFITQMTDDVGDVLIATYDPNGYLVKGEVFDGATLISRESYSIVDGNAVQKVTYYKSGSTMVYDTAKYLYHYDKENKGGIIEDEGATMRLIQKPYKNLFSEIRRKNGQTRTYGYTFDTDGFPKHVTITEFGSDWKSRDYTFGCK